MERAPITALVDHCKTEQIDTGEIQYWAGIRAREISLPTSSKCDRYESFPENSYYKKFIWFEKINFVWSREKIVPVLASSAISLGTSKTAVCGIPDLDNFECLQIGQNQRAGSVPTH